MGSPQHGNRQSAGTSSSGPSQVLEVTDDQCSHFSGGSEFNTPLRLRHIQREFPEDYKLLDDKLQKVVGKYTRATLRQNFQTTRRYLSEVIPIRNVKQHRGLIQWFTQCGPDYPGGLFIWVDEGDHIHTIHDCPFSGGQCRCRFTQTENFRKPVRSPMRRCRYITELDEIDWQNVFVYFIMQKWESRSQVWIGGRLQGLPSDNESVLWGEVQAAARAILARENQRTRHNSEREQSDNEEDRHSVSKRSGGPPPKRGKFERITETVQILLDKYACVPPTELKDIIDPDHVDYRLEFHDPKNIKMYEAACHIAMLNVNRKTLLDFKLYYEGKTPIFYANDMNPFSYYHDRETSADYLNELLKFQCKGDEDKVIELLGNIKTWFNRLGWSMPVINSEGIKEYQLNPKINCIAVIRPPNSGKNYFWDAIAAIAMNVGHIGRVNNKVNQFALQDCYNRRLVMGNEINMEEGAKEDFKKLCEGTAFNIRVKYQGDKIFKRTPACLISNYNLDICNDSHFNNVRLHTMRWSTAPMLAASKKKPYPLAIFDLFDLYNVSLG
ncbi:uncharacterized protein LOC124166998 [Ischnura elegans]|uniref:uncharacterized protein LOC124166998 n=1 Tax=Ischnura elegans TaxID=197161 RepID=UPI001ED89435|nr:uncharacterized protein LOC124166998 [Ischnura elegans]